ncbi:MAG: hypothetical protein KDD64_14440 [Bdellovibrionales bacterium]|nr:hypothetical protein [Bdellovibrionales bacterium]
MQSHDRSLRSRLLGLLLRPVVRYCLKNSYSIQQFYVSAKELFAKEAALLLEESGRPPNASRISVLTGLTRTDVGRLLSGETSAEEQKPNLVWRILGQWSTDKRFTTRRGDPKTLDAQNDFPRLCESVSKHINPGTFLQELEALGLVDRRGNQLALLKSEQVLHKNPEKSFEILSQDIESLISCISQNALHEELGRNLHLRTEYDNVSLAKLEIVRAWIDAEGKEFHKRARDFISQYDADVTPSLSGNGGCKVVISAFGFIEKPEL